MNLTYYGMSTRHLITRVREHLDFSSIQRSAIKNHILSCGICSDVQHGLKSFTVIKNCQSEFHTKIHEVLLIKKDIHPNLIVNFNQRSVISTSSVLNWSYVAVCK